MRRSPADLEVTVACSSTSDPPKRYTRDAGGDRVQLVDENPDAGVPGPARPLPDVAEAAADRRDMVRTGRHDREGAPGVF